MRRVKARRSAASSAGYGIREVFGGTLDCRRQPCPRRQPHPARVDTCEGDERGSRATLASPAAARAHDARAVAALRALPRAEHTAPLPITPAEDVWHEAAQRWRWRATWCCTQGHLRAGRAHTERLQRVLAASSQSSASSHCQAAADEATRRARDGHACASGEARRGDRTVVTGGLAAPTAAAAGAAASAAKAAESWIFFVQSSQMTPSTPLRRDPHPTPRPTLLKTTVNWP